MDLVASLPQIAARYDAVFTVVDRFSKLVKFTLCTSTSSAAELAQLFMHQIVYQWGLPKKIVSDRDPRFLSTFWTTLMSLLGSKLGLSSSYHLQTDS